MNNSHAALVTLAARLNELIEEAPIARRDLARWYEKAREIQAEITRPGGLAPSFLHFIWHFLADADIRLKDSAYAELQNKRIKVFIKCLLEGKIPSDDEISCQVP
jgi:hypothetical protein